MAAIIIAQANVALGDTLSSPVDAPRHCASVNLPFIPPVQLSRTERATARIINERAAMLDSAISDIEKALGEAGFAPGNFHREGLAWAGVVEGETLLIAVYRTSDATLTRLDAFGTEGSDRLTARLAVAQRLLAGTPRDCGNSFALVDPGIQDDDGSSLLYAIRLVDSQREIAWGMHYRFEVAGADNVQAQRLHVSCSTSFVDMKDIIEHNPPPPGAIGATLAISQVIPDREFPSEAQMLQFRRHSGLSYPVQFMLKGRQIGIPAGSVDIPDRFTPVTNPCMVAPPTG